MSEGKGESKMDKGIRNGILVVSVALSVAGCGDTTKIEQIAGDYACGVADNMIQNKQLTTGAAEGIAVAAGVVTQADLEEGKRVIGKAVELAGTQLPVEQLKAMSNQANCKAVVGTATDLVRTAAGDLARAAAAAK